MMICPKCGSSSTEIFERVREDGKYEAHGSCNCCSYVDTVVVSDDEHLAFEIARRSFTTVYVNGSDDGNVPSKQALGHDISKLLKIICGLNPDCSTCQLHSGAPESDYVMDEGYFCHVTKLGVGCADQNQGDCAKRLSKKFPGLPDES